MLFNKEAEKTRSFDADIEDIYLQLNTKIDFRNTVEHTFSTTSSETFRHQLGRVPRGVLVIAQSQAAAIHYVKDSGTKTEITMRSSASGTVATMLLF